MIKMNYDDDNNDKINRHRSITIRIKIIKGAVPGFTPSKLPSKDNLRIMKGLFSDPMLNNPNKKILLWAYII